MILVYIIIIIIIIKKSFVGNIFKLICAHLFTQ